MLSPTALLALGPDGLADLLRRRPEALDPVPPASLHELAARLGHRSQLLTALRRLDLPTLQVIQAVAVFSDGIDLDRLHTLLGVTSDNSHGSEAVQRALAAVRANLLLDPGSPALCLLPEVRLLFGHPLGLGPDVRTLASGRTADDLRAVVRNLGVSPGPRKADLVDQVSGVLADAGRVRRLVGQAPGDLAEQLVDVAHGRRTLSYYGWVSLRRIRSDQPRRDPVEWALERLLLVRPEWESDLVMPAEVALALRGPEWAAPFDVDPPRVDWTPRAADGVARAGAAAAAAALRTVSAVLDEAGTTPFPLLKSGAIGVRELRRIAAAAGCEVREVRLVLALAHALALLDAGDEGVAPTSRYDGWQRLPAPVRYARLVAAWLALPGSPFTTPTAAWAPETTPWARPVRHTVLTELAEHPDTAPADARPLVLLLAWRTPLVVRLSHPGSLEAPGEDPAQDQAGGPAEHDDGTTRVLAALDEAAWLGVTGDGALSPSGSAALTGGDVAAAVAQVLGSARSTARLQADLTAVVLGEADPELAAALDLAADRENRSAAGVWRFSPASVRRALDTGLSADDLLVRLTDLAEGGVPQPLEYLVRDVERRHGAVRGGQAACYLRSDDTALLAEIVADRKLRSFGFRHLAPTVVVGRRPLPETLATLRAAGHAPVEEGPDGATVVTRRQQHRVVAEQAPVELVPEDDGLLADDQPDSAAQPSAEEVAAALVGDPSRVPGTLMDIGSTVVDLRALTSREALQALW